VTTDDGRTFRCSGIAERLARKKGFQRVAGVDEVGRGCLFGPVVAAAVILNPTHPVHGLDDSKVLLPEQREILARRIQATAVAWAVGEADSGEIDRVNILQASRLAMARAVAALNPACDYLLVDATDVEWPVPQRSVIKGDARIRCIAAASILAKVKRDAMMLEFDAQFPGYGLARHKGYATPEHYEALERLGPTPLHRLSYEPVRQLRLCL
jgi:ribonuclease HII